MFPEGVDYIIAMILKITGASVSSLYGALSLREALESSHGIRILLRG